MTFAVLRRRALVGAAGASLALIVPLGLSATAATASAPSTSTAATTSTASTASTGSTQTAAQKRAAAKAKAKAAKARKFARSPKGIAKRLVLNKHDWSIRQYHCVKALWHRESGWQVRAGNASGAYGIPQALPGHKMGKGWRHSAKAQVRWGLQYIDDRWGTPCTADQHQRANHWY